MYHRGQQVGFSNPESSYGGQYGEGDFYNCEEPEDPYTTQVDNQKRPGISFETLIKSRHAMAIMYILLSIGGLILVVLGEDKCTALSRQITDPTQQIGRTTTLAVSKDAGEICPQLVNALAMSIIGTGILLTTALRAGKQHFCDGIDLRKNSIMWIQFGFQAAMIFLVLLTVVGVVNVFELVFGTFLVAAQYCILWVADEINALYYTKRDLLDIDSKLEGMGYEFSDMDRIQSKYKDYFTTEIRLNLRPYIIALFFHLVIWSVAIVHLIHSLSGKSDVNVVYVIAFFIVSFFQLLVPVYIYNNIYPFCIPWFRQYRNMCFMIDITMFVSHVFLFVVFASV